MNHTNGAIDARRGFSRGGVLSMIGRMTITHLAFERGVEQALQALTPAEQYVLRTRFGIGTPARPWSQISPAHAHALEHRALRKLRTAALAAGSRPES